MGIELTLTAYFLGGLVVLGVLIWVVMLFNRLVRLHRNVDRAWRNIDVLLTQRHEEIPKLIDAAQEAIEYEEELLTEITEIRAQARKASSPGEQGTQEGRLDDTLGDLFVRAEDYPELQSSEQFQQLQERLSTIETQIADRREFYNGTVTEYNTRIKTVPYNIAAATLGYEERELFEMGEDQRHGGAGEEE